MNAAYLADRGAAEILEDGRLMTNLLPTVQALLRNPGRMAQLKEAVCALAVPQAAEKIAAQIWELADQVHDRT